MIFAKERARLFAVTRSGGFRTCSMRCARSRPGGGEYNEERPHSSLGYNDWSKTLLMAFLSEQLKVSYNGKVNQILGDTKVLKKQNQQ